MSTEYPGQIDLIQNGEPVSAGVTNRPTSELAQRTDALNQAVSNALIGSGIFCRDVPVEPDAIVGMAVYSCNDGVYRKALARMSVSSSGLETGLAPSAVAIGVIYRLNATCRADVLIAGLGTITAAQLAAVTVDGSTPTGQLYVSGTTNSPGKLTTMSPPVGVPVMAVSGPNADTSYNIFVNPAPRDVLEDHVHYHAPLTMSLTTSATIPGWVDIVGNPTLAATVFAGKTIPSSTAYGYNISADTTLSKIWPPVPVSAVWMERNGKGIRTLGPAGQVVCTINYDGIWWMSNCETDQPFGQASIDDGSGCVTYPDVIAVWFSRMAYKTSPSVVTSLTPANGTIVITDPDGNPATAGPLRISSTLPVNGTGNLTGFNVIKSVVGQALQPGVVLEGIQSSSDYITVTGGTAVGEVAGADPSGFVGGRVTLTFTNPHAPWEGGIDTMALDRAEVVSRNGVHAIVMRTGISSSIRGRVRIPTLDVPSTGMLLSFQFLVIAYAASGSATLPDLPLTVLRVPAPPADCTQQVLPSADSALGDLTLSDCGSIAVASTYLQKTSETLQVFPGDLVFISISRSSSDAYAGDIGIADTHWNLTTVVDSNSDEFSSSPSSSSSH